MAKARKYKPPKEYITSVPYVPVEFRIGDGVTSHSGKIKAKVLGVSEDKLFLGKLKGIRLRPGQLPWFDTINFKLDAKTLAKRRKEPKPKPSLWQRFKTQLSNAMPAILGVILGCALMAPIVWTAHDEFGFDATHIGETWYAYSPGRTFYDPCPPTWEKVGGFEIKVIDEANHIVYTPWPNTHPKFLRVRGGKKTEFKGVDVEVVRPTPKRSPTPDPNAIPESEWGKFLNLPEEDGKP